MTFYNYNMKALLQKSCLEFQNFWKAMPSSMDEEELSNITRASKSIVACLSLKQKQTSGDLR